MSNTKKSVSEHRLFVLAALERLDRGELATYVLKDSPVESYRLCPGTLLRDSEMEWVVIQNDSIECKKPRRRGFKDF